MVRAYVHRPLVMLAFGVALLAPAAVATRQSASPQTPATGTSAISGVVTDAATGRPLAGASVIFVGAFDAAGLYQPFLRPTVQSDVKGRFVFVDLPATLRYKLMATLQGYQVAQAADGIAITVAEGEWKRDITIRMMRPGSLTGRVVDEIGEPMVGTAVRLFTGRRIAGRELLLGSSTVSTDDRGVYRFLDLEPGRYYVAVLSVQSTVPTNVVDGARALPLGGLESLGTTSPRATVPTARGASIDVDGRHRLVLTNFAPPPPPDGKSARAYPPVFYPNARTVADAQSIDVPAGGSTVGIDLQLVPVMTSSVSGRVSGASQTAANMVLRLMPAGAEHLGFGSEVATTLVEADGTFTFLNVPAGAYTVVANSVVGEITAGGYGEGRLSKNVGLGATSSYSTTYLSAPGVSFFWSEARSGSTAWGRTAVTVGANIVDLDVPLHETSSVRGHAIADDISSLRPGERFTFTLEPADSDLSVGALFGFTASDTGAFSIMGLGPSRYLLRLTPSTAWRVKSVVANGVDLVDSGFDGTSGQDFSDVVVSVTKTGALIDGTVHDHSGAPTIAAVILFPVDPKAWNNYGLSPDRLRSVSTDSAGHYRLPLLRDGDYFVIAVPLAQSKAWLDPRFLAAAAGLATRVTLSSAGTTTQDLSVAEVVVK